MRGYRVFRAGRYERKKPVLRYKGLRFDAPEHSNKVVCEGLTLPDSKDPRTGPGMIDHHRGVPRGKNIRVRLNLQGVPHTQETCVIDSKPRFGKPRLGGCARHPEHCRQRHGRAACVFDVVSINPGHAKVGMHIDPDLLQNR